MLQYSHRLCLLSEFSTLRADGFEPRATVSSLEGSQWATPIARHKITIFIQTKKSGGFIRVRVLQWSGPDKSCINITLKGHMAPGCWGWGWGEGGLKYELFFPHSFISLGWNWDQNLCPSCLNSVTIDVTVTDIWVRYFCYLCHYFFPTKFID